MTLLAAWVGEIRRGSLREFPEHREVAFVDEVLRPLPRPTRRAPRSSRIRKCNVHSRRGVPAGFVVIFQPAGLGGAYLIELEPIVDERGFFARSWCRSEFEELGLSGTIEQCNIAFNERRGTVRGMHFQRSPHEETKVVRCTAGAIFDVIVDLRQDSPTYLQWRAIELSAENRRALFVPAGLAHGYQTLEDRTETSYLHSVSYAPGSAAGVRWDDPAFAIDWPRVRQRVVNSKDRSWADYDLERPFF